MLDLNLICDNPDLVKTGIAKKGGRPELVDRVLRVNETRRQLIAEIEKFRAEKNKLAHQGPAAAAETSTNQGKKIKEMLRRLEPDLKAVEEELQLLLNRLPNLPADDVPEGGGEEKNVKVRQWGKPAKLGFKPKDHLQLGKDLGILDFETGAKVAGAGFYYWLNEGAILEIALVRYAFDFLAKEGFTPVITPDLARARYYLGTGYAPKGPEAQTFEIEDEDLGLIATAEVTLAGRHADEVIEEKDLPVKYVGYSHCFRREAGAYGKYSKGLFRVHQFTKVEIFVLCLPEESAEWHERILALEEKIYQALELPYRVMKMCTGDLGAVAARKYDLDVWMAGRGDYGEVTSTSDCTDYQARNLNIRFKRKSGGVEFLHLLNGTAVATSRTPLAILENYQQADGSVLIPKALQKYTGFKKISPKR